MSNSFGQGKKTETKQAEGFNKYVGFFRGNVVGVNPTRSELDELQGRTSKEDSEELSYTSEKDGVRTARVTFWIEADGKKGKDGKKILIPHSVTLKDRVRMNKNKDKVQVITQAGDDQYVTGSEDGTFEKGELFDSYINFQKITKWKLPNGEEVAKWKQGAKPADDGVEVLGPKESRAALEGETDIVKFVKVWMDKLDTNDPSCKLLLNTEELFDGDFSQLSDIVGHELTQNEYQGNIAPVGFVALAYVKVDETDPTKQYQKIFRTFLPANFIKFIINATDKGKDIRDSLPNSYAVGVWDKFMKEVNGQYGPDGSYILEPLTEYDEQMDFATSGETRQATAPEEASY